MLSTWSCLVAVLPEELKLTKGRKMCYLLFSSWSRCYQLLRMSGDGAPGSKEAMPLLSC